MLLLVAPMLLAQQLPVTPEKQPASTAPKTRQILSSYEGQTVSTLEIAGRPDLDTGSLRTLLPQKAGEPFSREKVDQSVAVLKKAGNFQDVQLQVVPDLNGVRVLLVVQPGMYFGMYDFPGAVKRFSYARLLQISNYPPEGPYTPVDIENAQAALLKYFQRSGYFQAKVRPEVLTNAKEGIVNVVFHTELGKRAKFGKVTVEGATPDENRHLEAVAHSLKARLRGAAIREGKTYSLRTLQSATQYLETALMKEDRLGAKVRLIGANYDPETNRADVSFNVESGPKVKVTVEGVHLWSWTRRKLLPVYQQVGIDSEIIQEGQRNLVSYMQSKGYFEAKVDAGVREEGAGRSILYSVTKGPRHKVTDAGVAGNRGIESEDLLPSIAVKKARWFYRGKYSEKVVRTSVKNLEAVYRAAGYSSVKVAPEIKREGGNIEVVFRVDEGPRDTVQELQIAGNETQPAAALAPKGLKVVAGQPYSQKLVDEDRNQIMARYLEMGYLTATFRETVKASPQDPHQIVVRYQISEGPRVTTGNVITLGRSQTQQAYINLSSKLRTGRPLSEADMLTSESQLYEPGIFDWAEVDPRRQITTQDREDVVLKVHEAKRNTLTYGFGFEVINRGGSLPSGTVAVPGIPPVGLSKNFRTSQKTFWGPRGTVEYTRKNLRGKGESFSVAALAGRLIQRGSVNYLDPNFRYTSWSATLTLTGERNSENPIFTSRRGEFVYQMQHALDAKKTQNLFVRYSYRQTGLTNLLITDLVPQQDQHVRLSTLSATYIRDTRDSSLDAHKGIYQSYEFAVNPSAFGSSVNYSRFLGQTAYYKKISADIIWANSIRLGLEQEFADSRVPISEMFFSGGGSTLRGFSLNGAGPQRTITACGDAADPTTCSPVTVPVGGNQLFIVNSELRIPLPIKKGLGLVTFYDGGNVFRDIGFSGQYTNSFGIGLRYATPVGPVRIDIGHNLNAPAGAKATQIFITLGQAF